MSAKSFDEILQRARQELTAGEVLELINELCQQAAARNGRRNICELRGLGKELWADIDADEYVRKERDSWNG